ncbi:MAG TPA: hypothetical protein VLB82_03030 [Thermodesulfobacteriota bacterium]|nr:hypothetical protein [Thermodesulfobacteriota bacterium]
MQKKVQRLKFLEKLYKLSNGKSNVYFNTYYTKIAEPLGFDIETATEIFAYLKHEGLIAVTGGTKIALTHKGLLEYESAMTNPEKDTEHFPAGIINNYLNVGSNINNMQIQIGTKDSIQTQSITIENSNELIELLEEILNKKDDYKLDDVDEEELIADITTAKTQIESSRPKIEIIKTSLDSVKRILESAVGSALANQTVQKLIPFIESLG